MVKKYKTITMKREALIELGLPSDCEGGKIHSNEIVGKRRWSIDNEIVFSLPGQPEGEAYSASYSVGATESQEERPWEYEDEVELTLVRLVPVQKFEWQPVEE